MPLTALAIKAIKPKEKPYKVSHEKGLYLLVNPNGSMYWRLKYRYLGKEKTLALGVYPEVSLKEATQAMSNAKKQLQEGLDPSAEKQEEKAQQVLSAENSFQVVAFEWYEKQSLAWSNSHSVKVKWLIELLCDGVGRYPINEITAPQLLMALRPIENSGRYDTASRAKQVAGQVFRYGVITGRCERDISQDLKGALTPNKVKHMGAVTELKDIPALLQAIEAYTGTAVVKAALQFAPLVFVRPGELRHAQWEDIDLEAQEWRFIASKTKQNHIVPLSKQAIEILQEIHPLTGRGRYVFPSVRSNFSLATNQRPMSENAITAALRTLGYTGQQMTGHGFRAMARTVLDEVLGYRIEWIEQQLAHAVKDVHGRAYNRTKHLEQRKEMMQGWADYLDQLKASAEQGNVINARFR